MGRSTAHDGYAETIEALINHPGYKAPLGKNQGRGVASGYWFNGGGEFERHRAGQRRRHRHGRHRQPRHRRLARLDGDHGGRDAGRRLQHRCAPIVADTASVGYTHVTGGSRVTFATGMAVVECHQESSLTTCASAPR